MQVAPYGVPQMGRSVSGVPLEPGERVLYFRLVDQMGTRVSRIIVGLITIPFLVGIYLLYAVFKDWQDEPDAQAVTNRRLLSMKRNGTKLVELRWEQVTGFTKVIRNRSENTFAVRSAQGVALEFAYDGAWLGQVLPVWAGQPPAREQAPEAAFR